MSVRECIDALSEAVARLQPVLQPLGFNFVGEESGEGHMSYASGSFIGDAVSIGLIFRKRGTLGCVIYKNELSNMSHDDLLRYLGARDRQRLVYNDERMASNAKGGGDPIDAFVYDLRELVGQHLMNRELMAEYITRSLRERYPNWTPSGFVASPPGQKTGGIRNPIVRVFERLRPPATAASAERSRGIGHYLLLLLALYAFIQSWLFLTSALHQRLSPNGVRFLVLTVGVFLTGAAALHGFGRRRPASVVLFLGLLFIQPTISFVAAYIAGIASEVNASVALMSGILGVTLLIRTWLTGRRQSS